MPIVATRQLFLLSANQADTTTGEDGYPDLFAIRREVVAKT
jgi:hypothetical protein